MFKKQQYTIETLTKKAFGSLPEKVIRRKKENKLEMQLQSFLR